MSGVLPYPRWMPPMPPVARKRRPARPQAASVAPTVVAPRPPSTMQAARSRGSPFGRRPRRLRSAPVARPRDQREVPHPAHRRLRAPRHHRGHAARTPGRPRAPRRRGSRGRRSSSRAPRPAALLPARPRPPSSRRPALASRHCSRPRNAACSGFEAELDAAHEEAGRERVAGARRVDDVGRERCVLLAGAFLDDRRAAGAVLHDERCGGRLASQRLELALAREDDVRLEVFESRQQLRRSEAAMPRAEARSTLICAPWALAAPAARAPASAMAPSSSA